MSDAVLLTMTNPAFKKCSTENGLKSRTLISPTFSPLLFR